MHVTVTLCPALNPVGSERVTVVTSPSVSHAHGGTEHTDAPTFPVSCTVRFPPLGLLDTSDTVTLKLPHSDDCSMRTCHKYV